MSFFPVTSIMTLWDTALLHTILLMLFGGCSHRKVAGDGRQPILDSPAPQNDNWRITADNEQLTTDHSVRAMILDPLRKPMSPINLEPQAMLG